MKQSAWRVMASAILGPKLQTLQIDPHTAEIKLLLKLLMDTRIRAEASVDAIDALINGVPVGGWKDEDGLSNSRKEYERKSFS